MPTIIEQFKAESQSYGSRHYVVTHYQDDSWACGCVGWTRHTPRKDCKHITWVKTFGPIPIDPLLMATVKARRKAGFSGSTKDV